MSGFCDVPTCPRPASEDAPFSGRLCAKHYEALQAALQANDVFRPEDFVGAPDTEDGDRCAADEGYRLWLARVADENTR